MIFSAPKGRHIPAQGEALGETPPKKPALKGRDIIVDEHNVAPFQGLIQNNHLTQGFALGWYVMPLWG